MNLFRATDCDDDELLTVESVHLAWNLIECGKSNVLVVYSMIVR